jgi:hypothetical protein
MGEIVSQFKSSQSHEERMMQEHRPRQVSQHIKRETVGQANTKSLFENTLILLRKH